MSDPVLERSVLERKERDELQTIARALGASPTSRLRKADLVDLILRTAGIGGEPAGATSADEGAPAPAPAPAEDPGAAAPAARGRGRRARATSAEEVVSEPAAPPAEPASPEATEPAAAGDAPGERAGRSGTTGDDRQGGAERGGDERGGDEGRDQQGRGDQEGRNDRSDQGRDQQGRSDRNDQQGRGDRGDQGRNDQQGRGDRSDQGRNDQQGRGDRNQNQGGGQQNDRNQGDRNQGDRNQNQGGGQQNDRNQNDRNQGDRNQGDRNQGAGQGQGGNQNQGGGQQGEDGEGGNRRRRRRNRDRGEGGGGPEGQGDESFAGEPVACEGLLDLRDEGYGFLRVKGYLPHKDDVYVSVRQVRQLGLRKGDQLTGASRPANRQEKNPALLRIDLVNGQDPEAARRRPRFEDLTPLFPDDKLRLETGTDPTNMTARIIDLVSPIGKGQRGLIVSPPKAGKTTILKQIVKSIERNNPDVHLLVLLVDERPEEVTDMRRSTGGEVIASTFDRPSEEHTAVSELTLERAKRLVEEGKDVVIVLDGITRLARAYNLAAPGTGRIMSGGIDTGALYPPKKFFGAARNVEEGGSLTILATALIETGSKMDEVIFEEFKGTGNMELRLDRRLAERRIYPAIDVDASSTRHEELLFSRQQLQQVWRVRRALHALSTEAGSPAAALERLMDGMKTFKTNEEFLAEAAKAGGPAA